MNNLKHLLVFCCLIGSLQVQAQQKTNLKKPSKASLDSAYLLHPFRDKVQAFKKNIKQEFNKVFMDFKDNKVYLLSGIGFSKQYITTGSYNSTFNYDLANNKSASKPGYYGGFRVDGIYKEKHLYYSYEKRKRGIDFNATGSASKRD